MRKVLFIILASLFVFGACKDKNKKYSSEQEDALKKLKGNYHAYFEREMILAVISFTAHYYSPQEVLDDKKNVLFDAHGQCYFTDSYYPIPEKGYIPCYYAYSEKADFMYFYYKSGEKDKTFMRAYILHIQNEDVFTLTDANKTLTFEKVK